MASEMVQWMIDCLTPIIGKYDNKIQAQLTEKFTNMPALTRSPTTYTKNSIGCLDYEEIGNAVYNQIIFYGQSLAFGTQAPASITTEAVNGNFMIGECPLWRKGESWSTNTLNPLIATTTSNNAEQPVVSAVNAFSKVYRRFVNKNQKFIGTSCGIGGRSIELLAKGCTNTIYNSSYTSDINHYSEEFLGAIHATKDTITALNETVNCSAIVFMQGENNYQNLPGCGYTTGKDATTDKNTYKQYLKKMKEDMQSDIMTAYNQTSKPLFFIYQTGGYFIKNKEASITMAQIEFSQENDDVFLLSPTIAMPKYNGGHLSINGYRWYGECVAKALYSVLVKGETPPTMIAKNVEFNDNTIFIDYYVPVPPLRFDTWTVNAIKDMGFRVYLNGEQVTINNIEIIANTIVIHCDVIFDGIIEIAYATNFGSIDTRGIGNLCDSDSWASLYTYADDTAIELTDVSIRRPSDEHGLMIYGNKYPMQNFASHLYYIGEHYIEKIIATTFRAIYASASGKIGDSIKTIISYTPYNANTGKEITWVSSDSSKLTVDDDGTIHIISGKVDDVITITGTLANGISNTYSFRITEEAANPYENYYKFYKFTEESDLTGGITNLVTNQKDDVLVGFTGTELTASGLQNLSTTAIKIPIKADMPNDLELCMKGKIKGFNVSNDLCGKLFASLEKDSASNKFGAGISRWSYANTRVIGVTETGASVEFLKTGNDFPISTHVNAEITIKIIFKSDDTFIFRVIAERNDMNPPSKKVTDFTIPCTFNMSGTGSEVTWNRLNQSLKTFDNIIIGNSASLTEGMFMEMEYMYLTEYTGLDEVYVE